MKRAIALAVLTCVFAAPTYADPLKSITWSRWVDIGPGRGVSQLNPAERAALRRCKFWTMYFIPSGEGLEQIFIAGMTMGTIFPKVLVSEIAGETVFVLVGTDGRTHDTLHLSQDGQMLTQISPPFRPHTYLRCADAPRTK